MSEQSIWKALRAGGLSEAGTAGMMGNMYCESALISSNVQDGMGYTDSAYTEGVDTGSISRTSFKNDSRGYGLCQWTYYSRKDELYGLAKQKGVSIADEAMQCDMCLKELRRDNSSLFSYLQSTNDVYTSTSRICKEFERPAVNNVDARYSAALSYYNKYAGTQIEAATAKEDSQGINTYAEAKQTTESAEISVRTVRIGDTGTDVAMLQAGLNKLGYYCGYADGIFGNNTLNSLNAFKQECNLTADGIADGDVWQILHQ